MNNPQVYAVEIEHKMERVFNCERYGVGGLVNSDHIRRYPFHSMICTLTHLYCNANKNVIDNFFDKYSLYSDWSIDTFLSFDTQEKVINCTTYTLDVDNGEIALENMISDFTKILE